MLTAHSIWWGADIMASKSCLPPQLDSMKLSELLQIHASTWPLGMKRFDLLRKGTGSDSSLFRAASWDPYGNRLFVQKVSNAGVPGCSMPIALRTVNDWLDDVLIINDSLRPLFMSLKLSDMPQSAKKGLPDRLGLLHSLLMVDPSGSGNAHDYVINDFVITDPKIRNSAIRRVCQALGKKISYRSYLLGLLTRYIWYGGGPESLANLAPLQGGPGVSRVGINRSKPGRLSHWEKQAADEAFFNGKEGGGHRQQPVTKNDLEKFSKALRSEWAEKRATYKDTYLHLVAEQYRKTVARRVPTLAMFKGHAERLIIRDGLKAVRLGKRLSEQHNDSRVGTSSDLTQGVIETVDFDGFVPKLPLRALVKGKVQRLSVRVIFGISRLSNAVLGYELEFHGESARAFRICLGSVFLPKGADAARLGVNDSAGLLSGNIDAIFADNGAGASESVLKMSCDDLGLARMLAPPARGDLKPFVESFNATLVNDMAKEPGGYTRRSDEVSKDSRQRARRAVPITLQAFERLVFRAVVAHNLYTNSSKLLTREMRDAGVGIAPADIFKYTQEQRRGDAARMLSKTEIYDRMFPWESKKCQKGVVTLAKCRYSSPELVAAFNLHAKSPGKTSSLPVLAKLLPGYEDERAIWKDDAGTVRSLTMLSEDLRSYGNAGEKQRYLDQFDVTSQAQTLEKKRRSNTGAITVKAQQNIASAEAHVGNPIAGFHGFTARSARANATQLRDRSRTNPYLAAPGDDSSTTVVVPSESIESAIDAASFEAAFYKKMVGILYTD